MLHIDAAANPFEHIDSDASMLMIVEYHLRAHVRLNTITGAHTYGIVVFVDADPELAGKGPDNFGQDDVEGDVEDEGKSVLDQVGSRIVHNHRLKI